MSDFKHVFLTVLHAKISAEGEERWIFQKEGGTYIKEWKQKVPGVLKKQGVQIAWSAETRGAVDGDREVRCLREPGLG